MTQTGGCLGQARGLSLVLVAKLAGYFGFMRISTTFRKKEEKEKKGKLAKFSSFFLTFARVFARYGTKRNNIYMAENGLKIHQRAQTVLNG